MALVTSSNFFALPLKNHMVIGRPCLRTQLVTKPCAGGTGAARD
jgi:hypothetical protein